VRGLKIGLLFCLTKLKLSLHRRSKLGNSIWHKGRLILGKLLLLSYVSWLRLAKFKLVIFLLHDRPERDWGLVELLLLWLCLTEFLLLKLSLLKLILLRICKSVLLVLSLVDQRLHRLRLSLLLFEWSLKNWTCQVLCYKTLFLLNLVLLSYIKRVWWLNLRSLASLVHVEYILRLRQISYGFTKRKLGLKIASLGLVLSNNTRHLTLEAAYSTNESILLEPLVLQTLLFFLAPFNWFFFLLFNSFLLDLYKFFSHHIVLFLSLLILLLWRKLIGLSLRLNLRHNQVC